MQPLRLLLRLHDPVAGRRVRLGLAAAGLIVLASSIGPSPGQAAGVEGPGAAGSLADLSEGQLTAFIARVPTITLSLSVGPPGCVTTVTGRNFAGLQQVRLQWSRGIPYRPPIQVVTQDSGTFVTQFLVVSGDDVYGPRQLQASVAFFSAAGELSLVTTRVVARAQFTVVPHTAGPPAAETIRTFWGNRPPWFRH